MEHLAVIMDGNGRWAVNKGRERAFGYRYGAEAFTRLLRDFSTFPFSVLTVYAFSTENNNRDKEEVSNIYAVIASFLLNRVFPFCRQNSINVDFIGDKNGLPEELKKVFYYHDNSGKKTVVIALNYGGLNEIKRTFDRIITSGVKDVSEKTILEFLDTNKLPPVDAVLRYGGYKRLSNFLPLQTSYAELFFTDKFFPDYDRSDIEFLLSEFKSIKRNFGGNND